MENDKKQILSKRRAPRQKRSQETFEAILTASIHILNEDPTQFNTNFLAAKAGISVGSLYQYFSNKDEVLDELLNRYIQTHQTILDSISDIDDREIEEIVRLLIEKLLYFRLDELPLQRAILIGLGTVKSEQIENIKKEIIFFIIQSLLARGALNESQAPQMALALHAFDSGLDAFVCGHTKPWLDPKNKEDQKKVITYLWETICRCFSAV